MSATTIATGLLSRLRLSRLRLSRLREGVAGVVRAHEVLWAALERIDPDPSPYLHWEPTASGWRLYGNRVPPARGSTAGGVGPGL